MGDYHVTLGLLAVGIGLVGYVPYYRDIFRGTTKPHPFSWLGFGLLNGLVFFAQIAKGGGAGAWTTAVSAVAIGGIVVLAFQRGEKNITVFDWICFAGAIAGAMLWLVTNDPLNAVMVITIADLLAFAPTFRKSYLRPHEETLTLFALSTAKYGISVCALTQINWTTALFPAVLALANGAIVGLILIRRKHTAIDTKNVHENGRRD